MHELSCTKKRGGEEEEVVVRRKVRICARGGMNPSSSFRN